MNKTGIALVVGLIAAFAGVIAAFVILRKKFGASGEFDEFEDFDMLDDDDFFDEDEFFGEDDGISEYTVGSDNTMPFAGSKDDESAEEEGSDDESL